jgi:hypothetical protein
MAIAETKNAETLNTHVVSKISSIHSILSSVR